MTISEYELAQLLYNWCGATPIDRFMYIINVSHDFSNIRKVNNNIHIQGNWYSNDWRINEIIATSDIGLLNFITYLNENKV